MTDFQKLGSMYWPEEYGTMPSGAIADTFPRQYINIIQSVALQVMRINAIYLPINTVISSISFASTNGATLQGSNWWFALFNSSYQMLAITEDQFTRTWNALTVETLPIAKVASGAASSFTTAYSGLHYLGILQYGNTSSVNLLSAYTQNTIMNLGSPLLSATATIPEYTPSFPYTLSGVTASSYLNYGYVS